MSRFVFLFDQILAENIVCGVCVDEYRELVTNYWATEDDFICDYSNGCGPFNIRHNLHEFSCNLAEIYIAKHVIIPALSNDLPSVKQMCQLLKCIGVFEDNLPDMMYYIFAHIEGVKEEYIIEVENILLDHADLDSLYSLIGLDYIHDETIEKYIESRLIINERQYIKSNFPVYNNTIKNISNVKNESLGL